MCVARLCTDVYTLDTVQWRQTHNRDTDKELIRRTTNSGSYSLPTELMSLSHDGSHAITSYLDNKDNLRLTHFQCSQYVWSRNQGRVFKHNNTTTTTTTTTQQQQQQHNNNTTTKQQHNNTTHNKDNNKDHAQQHHTLHPRTTENRPSSCKCQSLACWNEISTRSPPKSLAWQKGFRLGSGLTLRVFGLWLLVRNLLLLASWTGILLVVIAGISWLVALLLLLRFFL